METTGNLAIQPASCGLGQGLRAYRQLGSSGGLGLGFGEVRQEFSTVCL